MNVFIQDLAAANLGRVVNPGQMDTEYILESLEQAMPMLRGLARQYDLDASDLYQESYLVAHKIMSDPQKPHHRAYIQGAIRLHVYEIARHRKHAVSLDAPLSSSSDDDNQDMTLIDLLVEPARPQQTRRDYYRKRALLKALRRLPECQQRAISLFYRIDALSHLASSNVKVGTLRDYSAKSKRALRNDKYLTKAIMGKWR
jgi:DNA-directed RNA polymerase specialized sigma24 family protein